MASNLSLFFCIYNIDMLNITVAIISLCYVYMYANQKYSGINWNIDG